MANIDPKLEHAQLVMHNCIRVYCLSGMLGLACWPVVFIFWLRDFMTPGMSQGGLEILSSAYLAGVLAASVGSIYIAHRLAVQPWRILQSARLIALAGGMSYVPLLPILYCFWKIGRYYDEYVEYFEIQTVDRPPLPLITILLRGLPQFSLRALLLLVAAAAVYFCIAVTTSYVEATGLTLGAVLLTCAIRWRGGRSTRLRRWGLGTIGMVILWFAAVDLSIFSGVCSRCGLTRTVIKVHVVQVPVFSMTWRDDPTPLSRFAEDVGVPCSHELESSNWVRFWGMVFPCQVGPHYDRLSGDESWYNEAVSKAVRRKAQASPELGEEFQRRVLRDKDFSYWRELIQEIRGEVTK